MEFRDIYCLDGFQACSVFRNLGYNMTSDDIIKMAMEAGATTVDQDDPQCYIGDTAFDEDGLKRFYAMAVASERDACIAAVKSVKTTFEAQDRILLEAVKAIRERRGV